MKSYFATLSEPFSFLMWGLFVSALTIGAGTLLPFTVWMMGGMLVITMLALYFFFKGPRWACWGLFGLVFNVMTGSIVGGLLDGTLTMDGGKAQALVLSLMLGTMLSTFAFTSLQRHLNPPPPPPPGFRRHGG